MAAFKNVVLFVNTQRYSCYSYLNLSRFKSDKTFTVKEILRNRQVGSEVFLKGWVKSIRKQKFITFLHVGDGSPEQVQVTIPSSKCEDCCFHSAVEVRGLLVESPKPNQPYEIQASEITVVGKLDLDHYPFGPRKYYPPEYLRQQIHLRPKTNVYSSVLRLTSIISTSLLTTLIKDDFVNIFTPILTSNDCEGAGEVFTVRPASDELCQEMGKSKKPEDKDKAYFDKKVFLTVSSQLHLEAIAGGISKVFTMGPTFRSENSRTRRHLAEFRMLEAEIAFCDDLQPLLSTMERLIKQAAGAILEDGSKEMAIVGGYYKTNLEESLDSISKASFATLSYEEAIQMLIKNQHLFKFQPRHGQDLATEHELFLVEQTGKPTFVVDWPARIKPFYMRTIEDNPSLVSCVDLLVPEVGELCGGSLRENRYDLLKNRLQSVGLEEDLSWYLDLRRFGGSPTGGFGMGIERLVSFLLKIPNVKDIVPFPRTPHNCPM